MGILLVESYKMFVTQNEQLTMILAERTIVLPRAGLRGGGNGGNCPGLPDARGPRDGIYLFQIKLSLEILS